MDTSFIGLFLFFLKPVMAGTLVGLIMGAVIGIAVILFVKIAEKLTN